MTCKANTLTVKCSSWFFFKQILETQAQNKLNALQNLECKEADVMLSHSFLNKNKEYWMLWFVMIHF